MKRLTTYGLQIFFILAVSTTLALLFNNLRPQALSWIPTQEDPLEEEPREEITLAEAAMLFETGQAVFLDARDNYFYTQEHIQGALSLPPDYFDYEFPRLADQLTDKTVITYCDGELCSLGHELAIMLKDQGLPEVYVLVNGWWLWKNENLPVTRGAQP